MAVIDGFRINGTDYDLRDAVAVRFNESQSMTDAQKQTARGNIEAIALNQGVAQAGKTLVVGADGNVTTGEVGVSDNIKTALLDIFDHVAFVDGDGQEYINALYDALYAIEPGPVSGIMLNNGSKTFSDGTVVTVNNNHITVVLGSATSDRYINLSNLSNNSNDITNANNLNEPTGSFVTINSNETLVYTARNAKANNTTWTPSGVLDGYDISTNIRGTNNTSILPGMHLYPANSTPEIPKTTSATGELTATSTTVGTNVILFISHCYPAGTRIEFDVVINKVQSPEPQPVSGIMLNNGSKTFSDGTVVTVNNNHVTVVLGSTASGMDRYINLSNLSNNSNDITTANNLNEPTGSFVTINANETLVYTARNAKANNTTWTPSGVEDSYDVSTNIRGTNNTSILPGMHLYPANSTPDIPKTTSATGELTATGTTIGTNVILFISHCYPAGTRIELDVLINKE